MAFVAASLGVACGIGLPSARAWDDDGEAAVRHDASRVLMGVDWSVTVYAHSQEQAVEAAEAALDRVAEIERVLSDYDRQSEVSLLMEQARREPGCRMAVSDDLARAIERSLEFSRMTGGGFDVTVGPLTALWRQSRKTGRLPNAEKLAAARAASGRDALQLFPADAEGRRNIALAEGARLDFGGIGMGFAIDEAMRLLADRGITSAMIDASGDIAVSGPPPGRHAWRIEVAPLASDAAAGEAAAASVSLQLVHAAVATSGDAFQAVVIDGVRYSHIVDPRTGMGVEGPTAVTVVAADATSVDALSTAVSVLGPVGGPRLIESLPQTAARFCWVEGDEVRVLSTSRWHVFTESP